MITRKLKKNCRLFEQPVAQLYRRATEQRVTVRVEGLRELEVLVATRQTTAVHALQGGVQRYLVAVSTQLARGGRRRVEVRSPLRLRNDTAFTLAVLYRKSVLDALGAEHDAVRMALLAPDETLCVPLLVAHHCKLYVKPAHLDQCGSSEAGLLLAELAPGDAPRDLSEARETFCVRALVQATSEDPRDVTVCLVPPLVLLNELPLALEVSAPDSGLTKAARLEAGASSAIHALNPAQTHKVTLQVPSYVGTSWSGTFSLSGELEERSVSMAATEAEEQARHLALAVRLEPSTQHGTPKLHVFAPFWVINKTGLPLQIRGVGSDAIYESRGAEEPLLFSFRRRRRRAVRLRVHQSSWSSAFSLEAAGTTPGLVVCRDRERGDRSCPACSPCPPAATRKHLRFMEDNERADLWVDLAPGQSTSFWPETETMRMFVRLRGSQLVSAAFPVGRPHRCVLRMDKGCGLTVEVTSAGPLCVWFRHTAPGEVPVRVDNQCAELAVRLQQRGATASWVLGSGQALLYTWDEPCKEPRQLLWSVAKGESGYVAEIGRDGFGHERLSGNSSGTEKQPQQHGKLSSRLSAGLRKLSVRPAPEPLPSSSDEDDSQGSERGGVVHWVSYLEGRQRVLLITRDERLARQVRAARLDPERVSFELCVALAGVGMSLCGEDTVRRRPREVAYLSLQDAAPVWEVLGARRWRALPGELAAWLEEQWREQPRPARAQLRDLVHVDLTTLRMTKPFFGELRRRHAPALWLQYRRGEATSYLLGRVHRLQATMIELEIFRMAEIGRDGFGHERLSGNSSGTEKQPQQHGKLSSRLSAGLRKLSVRPAPEPLPSSSDEDDSQGSERGGVVHWLSYLEGRQRVLLITRDERLARQVRAARLDPERVSFELCVALAGVGLSLCGEDTVRRRPREVAYLSLQDAAPVWEVLGARRWRALPGELAAWLEERWREQPRPARAQLRDLVHVDLTTLRMTKPFFGELRRRHAPALWLQYRRGEATSYLLGRVDNQLNDSLLPCVVFPGVSRRGSSGDVSASPCLELSVLRSYRAGHLVLKLGSLELRGGEMDEELIARHYAAQLAQQFATRVLGLDVLENPLSVRATAVDLADVRVSDELSEGLAVAALGALGHMNGGVVVNSSLLELAAECAAEAKPEPSTHWHVAEEETPACGLPAALLSTSRSLELALPLSLAGLFGAAPVPGGPPQPEDSFLRGAGRGVLALVKRGSVKDCLAVLSDALRR
ncbi:hypothetical protein B566_EDAN017050 [Ephemera danica]|nr:hypothetical protein B566_EDAN017050 [Ephemera danica]